MVEIRSTPDVFSLWDTVARAILMVSLGLIRSSLSCRHSVGIYLWQVKHLS